MAKLTIELIPAFQDNYIFLAYDRDQGVAAVVDPGEAAPVLKRLEALDLTLTHIFNTHHHLDHTGANLTLKEKFGLTIAGPRNEAARIPGIDVELGEGDRFTFGSHEAQIFDVPGHTAGHIAWWFEGDEAIFTGDTLFALGCGRLFEGTPDQMWNAMSRLRTLPPQTKVYCAHEYTMGNAAFAATVEPDNAALMARIEEIKDLRAKDIPTVPTTIGLEAETNPFMRADSPDLQRTIGLEGGDLVAVFAETRARKDNF